MDELKNMPMGPGGPPPEGGPGPGPGGPMARPGPHNDLYKGDNHPCLN